MMRTGAIALLLFLAGCQEQAPVPPPPPGPPVDTYASQRAAVEALGMSEARIETGDCLFASWLGCSRGDTCAWTFRAKSPSGQPVNGTICGGLLYGAYSVRLGR